MKLAMVNHACPLEKLSVRHILKLKVEVVQMTVQDVAAFLGMKIVFCALFFGVFGIVGFAYSINPTLGITYFFLAVGSFFILLLNLKFFIGIVVAMLLTSVIWRLL